MNRQQILTVLQSKQDEIRQQFGVEHIGIFGSAARDELKVGSDVDVLVEFSPEAHVGLFGFVRLQKKLEHLLGRKVDIATPRALKAQLRERIMRELIRVN